MPVHVTTGRILLTKAETIDFMGYGTQTVTAFDNAVSGGSVPQSEPDLSGTHWDKFRLEAFKRAKAQKDALVLRKANHTNAVSGNATVINSMVLILPSIVDNLGDRMATNAPAARDAANELFISTKNVQAQIANTTAVVAELDAAILVHTNEMARLANSSNPVIVS